MKQYIQSAIGNVMSENRWERMEIARTPSTPIEVLKQLSSDKDRWVRENVAKNPNATADILSDVYYNSSDNEQSVYSSLATNPNTPTDILWELVQHGIASVQQLAVQHPNATEEMYEVYENDIDTIKEEAIAYARELLDDALMDFYSKLQTTINSKIPRYDAEWWNSESRYGESDFIRDLDRTHPDKFEEVIEDILFGKADR